MGDKTAPSPSALYSDPIYTRYKQGGSSASADGMRTGDRNRDFMRNGSPWHIVYQFFAKCVWWGADGVYDRCHSVAKDCATLPRGAK